MRQFVVTTTSESSDHYVYLIEHENEPTQDELDRFLMTEGCDYDEERTYEYVDEVLEITEFQKIPKK